MTQQRPEIRLAPTPGQRGPFTEVKKAKDAKGTLIRLWGYLKRQRRDLIAAFFFVTITTACNLAIPYFVGRAIDQYISVGDMDGLGQVTLIVLAIAFVYASTTWGSALMMNRVSQFTVRHLRKDVFAKLQKLPLRFFDQRPHGEVMSYLTNDVENVSVVLAENITTILSSVLTIVGMVILMVSINLPLAIVSIIIIPMTAYFTRYISTHTRQGFRNQQDALAKLNGHIEETITAGKVIRAFSREQSVIDSFKEKNVTLKKAAIYAQTYGGFMGPGGNMIYNFGFVLIASIGGWLALQNLVSVGIIATFLTYTQQIRRPVNDLAIMFNAIQSALAGAERVFSILDEPTEFDDEQAGIPIHTTDGVVTFQDVSFGYRSDVPTLKQINLDVASGQMIALVGPTGAGKTTIINLLSRFYDVDSGEILLDGQNINLLNKRDLRRELGIVLQDTFLFSETVMENIRYGRLDATDEEVMHAAKLANADHFISRLPNGYQEMLSERAENLSQGQRQLLSIARVILSDPAILILDEATSSVDTRTEIQVQEAMRRLMEGRTTFVIAHRLSTIREADKIVFINHGQVMEEGTHEELLAQKGHYYDLYTSQFKVGMESVS